MERFKGNFNDTKILGRSEKEKFNLKQIGDKNPKMDLQHFPEKHVLNTQINLLVPFH